jgi:hypothetical protein
VKIALTFASSFSHPSIAVESKKMNVFLNTVVSLLVFWLIEPDITEIESK